MRQQRNEGGYKAITLHTTAGGNQRFLVHRLVLSAFLGPPQYEEWQGSHMDGDPAHNAITNLAWEGRKANNLRTHPSGASQRRSRGEDHRSSKLNDEVVRAIRAEHARTGSIRAQARKYGVADRTILMVVLRRTWKHVTDTEEANNHG